jgi:hypothetical protein
MPYYFDEDQPRKAAELARLYGLDVLATEECGRKGTTDEQQLQFAAEQGRILITRNRGDFEDMTVRFEAEGRLHAGVLVVPPSIIGNDYAGLVRAVESFEQLYGGVLPPFTVTYLVPVRR